MREKEKRIERLEKKYIHGPKALEDMPKTERTARINKLTLSYLSTMDDPAFKDFVTELCYRRRENEKIICEFQF
jgi:hypothetical protein